MRVLEKCFGLLVAISCNASILANDENILWQDNATLSARNNTSFINDRGIQAARSLNLNTENMEALLLDEDNRASNIAARALSSRTIQLPLPDGKNVLVTLEPTDLLPEQLSEKYPSIRTYKIAKATPEILSGHIDYTTQGFHAMLLGADGETIFIDPENNYGTGEYISYRKSDQHNDEAFQCSTPEAHDDISPSNLQSRSNLAARRINGTIEYRIAIAATGEYTSLQGGTVASALSAIVTTLNRVNQVYEQSLGIRLSLVENNDEIIFTDGSSDPYSNFNIEALLSENQSNLDRIIGNNNYDIGHVFGSSGGGLAYIGSLCNDDRKAMAASGIHSPYGDSFDIDYVAHELGHQLGATHTFNGTLGICTGGARTARSAFEPGSGSSIMSYAGGCGSDDLQNNADPMFHSGNIQQIQSNITSGVGSSCGIQHINLNQAPSVSAGKDYTIPANTPFQLTATATDLDDDPLLYSWEQYDTGSASILKTDTSDNPLFRIFPPSQSNVRVFPSLKTLIGQAYINGELLPQTDRVMKFQVASYDGKNLPSMDQTQISVVDTGSAFKLDTPASSYQRGSYAPISWETANTQYVPISCHTVDLYLSTNGGNNFDLQLAQGINNTGSASVYIKSNIPYTNTARFKLSCTNSIFFSISSQNFAIGQELVLAQGTTRITENAESGPENTLSGGGSMNYLLIFFIMFIFLVKKDHSAE